MKLLSLWIGALLPLIAHTSPCPEMLSLAAKVHPDLPPIMAWLSERESSFVLDAWTDFESQLKATVLKSKSLKIKSEDFVLTGFTKLKTARDGQQTLVVAIDYVRLGTQSSGGGGLDLRQSAKFPNLRFAQFLLSVLNACVSLRQEHPKLNEIKFIAKQVVNRPLRAKLEAFQFIPSTAPICQGLLSVAIIAEASLTLPMMLDHPNFYFVHAVNLGAALIMNSVLVLVARDRPNMTLTLQLDSF